MSDTTTNINVQNASQSSQRMTREERFEAEFGELVDFIADGTKGNAPDGIAGHIGWFSGFKVSDAIMAKLENAQRLFLGGDSYNAIGAVRDADGHFRNQLGAYVKGLSARLDERLSRMYQDVPANDLIELKAKATEAIGNLHDEVQGSGRFDLKKASVMSWAAIEALNAVREAFNTLPADKEAARTARRNERQRADGARQSKKREDAMAAATARLSRKFSVLTGGDSLKGGVESTHATTITPAADDESETVGGEAQAA